MECKLLISWGPTTAAAAYETVTMCMQRSYRWGLKLTLYLQVVANAKLRGLLRTYCRVSIHHAELLNGQDFVWSIRWSFKNMVSYDLRVIWSYGERMLWGWFLPLATARPCRSTQKWLLLYTITKPVNEFLKTTFKFILGNLYKGKTQTTEHRIAFRAQTTWTYELTSPCFMYR